MAPLRPGPRPKGPIRPRSFHPKDFVVLGGSVAASLGLTWLLYSQLLPFRGAQGFVIVWVASFLLLYWASVRELDGPVIAKDRMMGAAIGIVAIGVVIPLALIIGYVTLKGFRFLRLTFFTTTSANVAPDTPAEQTGGLQAIIGTLEQVGIALVISVPLGILTAVYLSEIKGRLRKPVQIFVDAMSGVPSIVAGLFIYTALVINGASWSGFAAALALSILMLPTITRTAEVVLRLVPGGLREASLALGAPEWRTTMQVVLPTARAGLVTAVILGMARVIGETAPLIMTAFGSSTMNVNALSGPQSALPLAAFKAFQGTTNDVNRAWVYAFVLVMLVLVLFVAARRLSARQFAR